MKQLKIPLKFNKHRKRGYFPYVRYCKLKVSKKCKVIFKTKSRRTKVCPRCVKYLNKMKLNIRRYNNMNRPELQYDESINWTSETEGVYTYVEDDPIMVAGQLTGHSKRNVTTTTTRKDLEDNLNDKFKMCNKLMKEIEENVKKKNSYTKKPVMTSEMVRIKNALNALKVINDYETIEAQLSNQEEELQHLNVWIEKRQKVLNTHFNPGKK